MSGRFITLEGGEGCGKSTQAGLLAEYLRQKGIETVETREPGGTPEGEVIRHLLVTGDAEKFDPVAETLLYYADRRCHLAKVIFPALKQNKWVISDRYADSTEAYQYYGYNKRIKLSDLQLLYKITAGDFKPDLTLILDIEPEIGMRRSYEKAKGMAEKELRFESRRLEFHRNLRQGFLEIAKREPERCVVLDANKSVRELQREIIDAVSKRLEKNG